jgi:hypothetical protein
MVMRGNVDGWLHDKGSLTATRNIPIKSPKSLSSICKLFFRLHAITLMSR